MTPLSIERDRKVYWRGILGFSPLLTNTVIIGLNLKVKILRKITVDNIYLIKQLHNNASDTGKQKLI